MNKLMMLLVCHGVAHSRLARIAVWGLVTIIHGRNALTNWR